MLTVRIANIKKLVISTDVDHDYLAISSLGDDLRFELIKPVLADCSPETLSRLEKTSPVGPCSFPRHSPIIYPVCRHVTAYCK